MMMRKPGYTQGPWAGKEVDVCGQHEVGLSLGFVTTSSAVRRAIGTANARLIAAAPDLAEALADLFADYKQLADSGDAGSWSLEDQAVGKKAIEALRAAGYEVTP